MSSRRKHIPIKTGSLLPKPKAGLVGPFYDREFVQQGRLLNFQNLSNLLRDGLLGAGQQAADLGLG